MVISLLEIANFGRSSSSSRAESGQETPSIMLIGYFADVIR